MDLTRAEAVNEIVRAKTDRARSLALERMSGAVERRIRAARDLLVDLRASVEVMIDYPDEDLGGDTVEEWKLAEAVSILEGLLRGYWRGRIYQEGVSVAITGPTNSGKSSLFNLLLRQERAIVSEVHGTTRDWLEGMMSLEGIPIRLFDTAGMRDSVDPLEIEGMRRAEQVALSADLALDVRDSTAAPEQPRALAREAQCAPATFIKVWNKIDLPESLPAPDGFIPLSAATGDGLPALEDAMVAAILESAPAETSEPLIDSERQRDLFECALEALRRFRTGRATTLPLDLLAVDLAEALDSLGEITGEVTSEEILQRVFSSFCVGK
jgi:tRNA modification GTPase